DSKLEEFQRQINTNLYGIYNFTKAVLPGMIDRRSGSIINISSLAGKNSFVGGTMYSASKHAVMGFTKSLMLEVREYNIRTVVICPGSVESSFGRDSSTDPRSKAQILMPEDVADVVVAVIKLPVRALMSEIDLRPTNPSK
ncbi:MAG: SDR family NAD(P)-dependent oxidoreductase, partial [Bacteroidota bacterium]|nr:SDR family NAD(P)-dependent oxidoreductase [Bacteroidota bacterium]